jgi:preprotein translocase subunit SecE
MGKVKDEAPAAKTEKTASKPPGGKSAGRKVAGFFANFLSGATYKPMQGRNARIWTAVGLGVLAVAGLYAMHQQFLYGAGRAAEFGVPTLLGLAFAWATWRIVQYPPFVDFLVATEAEMNKVSWTTRDDLKRATVVVLTTVLLLSVFLFGVDMLWSNLLKVLGVLRFEGMQPADG